MQCFIIQYYVFCCCYQLRLSDLKLNSILICSLCVSTVLDSLQYCSTSLQHDSHILEKSKPSPRNVNSVSLANDILYIRTVCHKLRMCSMKITFLSLHCIWPLALWVKLSYLRGVVLYLINFCIWPKVPILYRYCIYTLYLLSKLYWLN